MAHFQFLLLLFILADVFALLATGDETACTNLVDITPDVVSRMPKAHFTRKLGKHDEIVSKLTVDVSPTEAPQAEDEHSEKEVSASGQHTEIGTKKRHLIDRSVAGGGVILGGLAATFLVSIFCYIRSTRRKNAEPKS